MKLLAHFIAKKGLPVFRAEDEMDQDSCQRLRHIKDHLISPFQGFLICYTFSSQGVALGYDIAPLQGWRPTRGR